MASSAGFVFYTAYYFHFLHKIIHGKIYMENIQVGSTPCTQRVEAVFGLSNQRAVFGFNVRRKCFAHTTAIRL